VIWAVEQEMARTIEDFLARRIRLLLLDARAASEIAGKVAKIMAEPLGKDSRWQQDQVNAFRKLADSYIIK
jgi:glycerol-3-phosphate dehydrogenase